MKRTQLKRTPLKRKPFKSKKSKKESEWSSIRAYLKERFAKAGIVSCELNLDGCIRAYNFGFTWGFAHSLKRDRITSEKEDPEQRRKELEHVIYTCGVCHKKIEDLGNKDNKMFDIVSDVINNRVIQIGEE